MTNLDDVRKILNNHIEKKGYTYRDVSLKIGRKDSYIQQYIKYGFPRRLNEIDRKKIAVVLGINEADLIDDELKFRFNDDCVKIKNDSFKGIDIFKIKFDDKCCWNVVGRVIFNQDEMGGFFGENNNMLKIIKNEGGSMAPLIENGDLIVFDESITGFVGDGVYMIKLDDTVLIKKIQKNRNNDFVLGVYNTKYEDIVVKKDEFEILGKVVRNIKSCVV